MKEWYKIVLGLILSSINIKLNIFVCFVNMWIYSSGEIARAYDRAALKEGVQTYPAEGSKKLVSQGPVSKRSGDKHRLYSRLPLGKDSPPTPWKLLGFSLLFLVALALCLDIVESTLPSWWGQFNLCFGRLSVEVTSYFIYN